MAHCQEDNDFSVYLDHSIEFPLAPDDFQNWETKGVATFTKDKLVVTPEVKARHGLVYNKKPLQGKEWMIDVQFQVGNNKGTTFGTNGIGIYLLKEVLSKDIDSSNVFGYSNEFIGTAIYLNAGLRKRDPNSKNIRLEAIQGITSDGSKPINTWAIPKNSTCYHKWRNTKDENGNHIDNTLRLHYNQDSLNVLFYDTKEGQFSHCFKLNTQFEEGVYLALSSASGMWDQDFHYIKTLKTMNPNKIDRTHRAEKAKKLKGEKFMQNLDRNDIMHENRLRYNGIDDLIQKVNSEINLFTQNSQKVSSLVRANLDKLPEDQNHLINLERMNTDLNLVMRDFSTLERMMAYTQQLIQEVEKRPPLKLPETQVQVESQVSSKRAALETDIRDLSIRVGNLEQKLEKDHSETKEASIERERSNRQKLVEARVTNDIPSSAISPELHQIIETSKHEVRSQTEGSGSWLKTILTWTILIGITYFMYAIYTGLKEEKLKM
ncbi:unnamed protein product [Moneuplotes crassus]|uniref:L-type lectin-like domain-containing protein n=1 Tax=Euplotes crassus TaxID=5936 RepID=A0AAD1UAT8_EUPCR|nr:unnamed protein product [Moneuplotes crassus]